VHLVGFIIRISDFNFIYWFNNPHIKAVGLKLTDTEARFLKNVTEKCVSANSFVKLTKNVGLVFIPISCPEFTQHQHMSATQRLNYWAESRVDSTEPANQRKGRIRLTNRDTRENKWTKRTLKKKKGKRITFFYLLFLSLIELYRKFKMSETPGPSERKLDEVCWSDIALWRCANVDHTVI